MFEINSPFGYSQDILADFIERWSFVRIFIPAFYHEEVYLRTKNVFVLQRWPEDEIVSIADSLNYFFMKIIL